MTEVAVLLSGCGVFDGAEIHESTMTFLALDEAGIAYQVVAPDIPQVSTINHITGEAEPEARNCLVEAARIARGDIMALDQANPARYDAVILPGGFGAAKNLCDFAAKGADMSLNPDIEKWLAAFVNAGKPVGLVCIAPVMAPKLYGEGVRCTIGNDPEIIAAITAMGGDHVECAVEDVCVDETNRLVSTPAYMLAKSIKDVRAGTKALVSWVVESL